MKVTVLFAILLSACAVGSEPSNVSADVAGTFSYTMAQSVSNPGTCGGSGAAGSGTLSLSDNPDGTISILEFKNNPLNKCYVNIVGSKFFAYCKLNHTNAQL